MKAMRRTDFLVFDPTVHPLPEHMDFGFRLSELATAVLREPVMVSNG